MSETGDSDEGFENVNHGRGRKRKIIMKIEVDSDEVNTDSGNDSSDSDTNGTRKKQSKCRRNRIVSNENENEVLTGEKAASSGINGTTADSSASDSSSDETLEKCPICLLTFRNQEVASPSTCDHTFCFICLEEWSKNVSTCPIDRLEFKLIAVRKSFSSQKPIRKVAVEGGNVLTEHGNDEDVTNCEICHRPDREDVMLLCDGCNQGYHMYCLTPPLEQVPEGSWYCDHCFESDEEDVEDLNLVYEDLREMGVSESRLRITEVRQPRVPRTRQTERVRARVFARTSGRRMTSENTRAMSTSTNRAGCRKRTKKRRSTRRRRTFVVEYDINNYDEKFAIKTTKRYIRKRRSRKRVKTSKRVNNSRNTVEKLFKAAQRSAVPTTSFSIFGSRNALEYFSDYEDDVETTYSTPSSTSVQTSVRIRNIGSVIRRKNVLAAMDAPVNQNERVDVLSSIMDLQDRWHNVSQNNSSNAVHIGSDGRLTFKETSNKRNTKSNDSSEKLRDAINQAPLYPRGNNPNFSGGGDRYDNYSNNYRNNAGFRNSGGGQYRHSTGIGFGMSPFRRDEGTGQFNRNFSNNIQISPILPDRLRNPQNNRQDRRNTNRSTANESLQPTGESSQTAAAGHFESPGACAESQQSMSRDSKSDNYNTVESTSPASNLSSIVPPLAPPPWNKNLFRLAGDYDDDDGGDCPNFSIYSAESLQVARAEPEVSKSSNKGQEDEYEDREEDLVQLGDDDEIPATIESGNRSRNDSTDIYEPEYPTDEIEESENKDENNLKSTDDSKVSEDADIPAGSIDEKGSNDLELSNSNIDEFVDKKSGLLDILGESDSEELIDKNTDIQEPSGDDDASEDINDDLSKDLSDEVPTMACENDQQNMQTESISEEEDRSYTPCLDEKIDQDDSTDIRIESHTPPKPPEREMADSDRGEVSTAGIDGMETELISDEDEEILTQDQCVSSSKKKEKDKDESSGKKPRKETFKKISKSTKERNYRGDKERERVKRKSSRSRSKSNDKENENSRRSDRKRIKRKELERYDVRNVIGQPRTYKDRYGRDTSRPPKSRSHTRSRSRRNRTRSRSKLRSRSISSKRNRRSFSISPSPVSYIKSSSLRRSLSSRRSRSKRSRSRRRTPMRRRTRTPLRVRSPSPKPNSKKKKYRQRSLSLSSRSDFRSRSRDFEPRKERSKSLNRSKIKQRKSKDHKKKKLKKRSPSLSLSPEKRSSKPVEYKEPTRKKKRRSKSKTPEQNVWQSNSPQVPVVENDHSWTPPLVPSNPANLTVILKNKDDGKKKDKKKKKDKRREISGKRERRKQRSEVRENPLAPSKEVFASGDNILVSVSFNKDTNAPHPPQQQMTVVTLPPTREEIISKRRSAEKVPKKQKKVKDKAQRKHRKVDSKPVAFIDLERSPFQVIVQSPKDVIILTDSDQELENNREFSNRNLNEEIDSMEPTNGNTQLENVEQCTPIERTEISQEQSFDSSVQQLGPKTPPEPPLIKFSLNPKTKQIKTRNPLHEEQDEIDHEQPEENVEEVEKSSANIIGPNTPPESGPCSPDAYDPFDPTKSPSASPSVPPADEISTPVENDSSPTEDVREARPQVLTAQEKGMNPVDLVMALMNSKPTKSHEICTMNTEQQYAMSSTTDGNDAHEKSDDGNMPKSITVLSNVLIASGKTPSRSTIPTIASPISKPPPAIGGMSQQSIVSKLPLPRTSSNSRQNNGGGTGGIDETVNEIESPYSPGSDDYDDLFEPPPENANSLQHSQRNRGQGKSKSSNKTELFDNLFGNASPVKIPSYTPTTMRKRGNKMHKKTSVKVAKMPGSGKMDEDQIKILDDLPSSAVELQVKDKFLRKLNRQERVVEEVKLVLKPHYTKKHITKDDYKEILRRAVPKICHSRSQEINPKKIQNLIEAYVKKFRQRNKFGILNTGQVSSAVKCAAYLKKL